MIQLHSQSMPSCNYEGNRFINTSDMIVYTQYMIWCSAVVIMTVLTMHCVYNEIKKNLNRY